MKVKELITLLLDAPMDYNVEFENASYLDKGNILKNDSDKKLIFQV